MPDLRRVVYGSSTPVVLNAEAVADILRVSRRNNAADGITGALLYDDGNVLQVLEGPAEAVARTYGRIQDDPRHRRVLTFLDRPAEERMFPDWSMGLVRADALSDEDRAGVRSMREAGTPAHGAVRHLLTSFREMAERQPTSARL